MNKLLKVLSKLFIGSLLGLGIEFLFSIGFYLLVQRFSKIYVDPGPFTFEYPLTIIFFLGAYLAFWKKQYTLTAGLFLGFLLFMLFMTFLFEVLAGPASL